MDISAIIYAAIGGGGGAALGVLLFSLFRKIRREDASNQSDMKSGVRGGLVGGLAVAGGIVMGALYDNMVLPRIVPLDDSDMIAEMPIFGVIKEQSPGAYSQILVPIDRAVRNGGVQQEDLNETRKVYFSLMEEKMQIASGEALRSLEEISEYQNKVLKEKEPRICTLILNGEPYPAIDQYFSEEDQKAEQTVMVNLFANEPRDPEFVTDLERGKMLAEKALLKPMKTMGITDIRPDPSPDAGNDAAHRKICDLAIAFAKNKQAYSDEDIMNVQAYLTSF
jgi:hypothetical protein